MARFVSRPSHWFTYSSRFGIREKTREPEARVAYHRWLAEYLENGPSRPQPKRTRKDARSGSPVSRLNPNRKVAPGSIVHVASGFLAALEARIRQPGEPRRQGTIAKAVYKDRRKHITDFLDYLNEQHGERTTSRMMVADLSMADVEGFDAWGVGEGYSSSQVNKRMQMVKGIIDRAGRPEHGGQVRSAAAQMGSESAPDCREPAVRLHSNQAAEEP